MLETTSKPIQTCPLYQIVLFSRGRGTHGQREPCRLEKARGEQYLINQQDTVFYSHTICHTIYILYMYMVHIYTQLYTCTRGSPHQSKKDYSLDVFGKNMTFLEL